MATYDLLGTLDLAGQTTASFTSIPNTDADGNSYKHLIVDFVAYNNGNIIYWRINGDTSGVYNSIRSYYDYQTRALGNTGGTFFYIPADLDSVLPMQSRIEILNYTSSNADDKIMLWSGGSDQGGDLMSPNLNAGCFNSSGAITSLTFIANGFTIPKGEVRLYGVAG